jgi:hypothetical protein
MPEVSPMQDQCDTGILRRNEVVVGQSSEGA